MSEAWRIVVADDYLDAADSLASALDTYGCTPYVARDGAAALELIRTCRPHAVLLELSLPRLPGWAVARAVRLDPSTSHTVMIAVTAWSRECDRLHAKLYGFDAYVLKPATVLELLHLVACTLEDRTRPRMLGAG